MRPGPTRLRSLAGEPDERLVALAHAGDERAFDEIVKRYRAPLLRHVRGLLPPTAAEDALQQAFINAYAALTSETATLPVSLRPWMYRVAHNAALNVARDPQSRFAPLPEGLDGVERPEEALQRSERLWKVVGALRALPERQREVIVRHALQGDSHEQIAADLGTSAGAIRQLAHRARRTVRDAAAALTPMPLLRWLQLAEPAAGGGATGAKVAAAAVVTAMAGGSALEITRHADRPARAGAAHVAPPHARKAERPPRRAQAAPAPATAATRSIAGDSGRGGAGGSSSGSSGSGSSGPGSGSSGPGSGSSGPGSGSSGSGSGGSGSSGSGSGSSGSDSSSTSGSGSSGSGSSGSGSSGSDSSGSDSGGSSGSGGSGSASTTSATSGSGTSGGSGSDSGTSGSSGSGGPGDGTSGELLSEPASGGSGSSGSGG